MSPRHPLFSCRLPEGWRILTVDEMKAPGKHSCVAGPFGSNISSKYFVDSGIPVIRGNNLRDDLTRFVPEGFAFVSEEQAQKYKAQHVRSNDLVFTCWGTLGQIGLIPENGPYPAYIISNKQLKLRPNREICDPLYLFYYLGSPEMVSYIRHIASSAAVPGINLALLKSFQVAVPPLDVQERIVSILSAYDDLIENNTRRIAILEEMAQALYQEWFVHFRFPGHVHVPLVDSPLGPIPEGWKPRVLGDIACDHRRGAQPEALDPETPCVGLEHIPRRSIALSEWGYASDVQSTKLRFSKGEILFGKIRPYFHKVSVAPIDGVCSSDTIVISAKDSDWWATVLMCVSSDQFVAHSVQTSNGTKMPRANWDVLLKYCTPMPPDALLTYFNRFVRDAVDQIHVLIAKNRNLRATRDLLLPKLISGEIDVSAISEEPIPEAAD